MPKIDKAYSIDIRHLPAIVEHLAATLRNEGYEVRKLEEESGDIILAVTQTGFFKMAAGLRTAFRCFFKKTQDGFHLTGKIGFFDQDTPPHILTMVYAWWPIALTQITGFIKSRNLDQHILDIIDGHIPTLGH